MRAKSLENQVFYSKYLLNEFKQLKEPDMLQFFSNKNFD